MSFFRRHWYDVGAVVALGTVVRLIFGWHDIGVLQRLLLLNFVALLVHQYEEYGRPGSEPAIMNEVLRLPKGNFDFTEWPQRKLYFAFYE